MCDHHIKLEKSLTKNIEYMLNKTIKTKSISILYIYAMAEVNCIESVNLTNGFFSVAFFVIKVIAFIIHVAYMAFIHVTLMVLVVINCETIHNIAKIFDILYSCKTTKLYIILKDINE